MLVPKLEKHSLFADSGRPFHTKSLSLGSNKTPLFEAQRDFILLLFSVYTVKYPFLWKRVNRIKHFLCPSYLSLRLIWNDYFTIMYANPDDYRQIPAKNYSFSNIFIFMPKTSPLFLDFTNSPSFLQTGQVQAIVWFVLFPAHTCGQNIWALIHKSHTQMWDYQIEISELNTLVIPITGHIYFTVTGLLCVMILLPTNDTRASVDWFAAKPISSGNFVRWVQAGCMARKFSPLYRVSREYFIIYRIFEKIWTVLSHCHHHFVMT